MINYLRVNPNTVKTKLKGLGNTWYEGETVLLASDSWLRTDAIDEIGDKIKY